jgi:predicted transcriptional regulator
MTIEEITNMQSAANIKFELAKKIIELMEKAEAKYDELGGEDWEAEKEAVQSMVFED